MPPSDAHDHTNFNPRSRVGNDGNSSLIFMVLIPISIHVPAWGTTRKYHCIRSNQNYFNPRSRVGNDFCVVWFRSCWVYFNPRSRVGSDAVDEPEELTIQISIHVPAWGTTILHHVCPSASKISIHVPAWGTTSFAISPVASNNISIHVPAWGTTLQ